MRAKTQYKLNASDAEMVLALVRVSTLAAAGERLGVDASTVFRSIQRIERGIGQRLFQRSRDGYLPSELAQSIASHAEKIEAELESARSATLQLPEQVSGTVRIASTDAIVHGLVAPALKDLRALHPLLTYELQTSIDLVSLTRHDADIAVRATRRPPQHLVGKHIGPIRAALYSSTRSSVRKLDGVKFGNVSWITPGDLPPDHPWVLWRKKKFPKAVLAYRVSSVLTVLELVALGMGVGILPLFLAQGRKDLLQLTDALDDCQMELWLFAHAESRHLRRVSTVFGHLSQHIVLA